MAQGKDQQRDLPAQTLRVHAHAHPRLRRHVAEYVHKMHWATHREAHVDT